MNLFDTNPVLIEDQNLVITWLDFPTKKGRKGCGFSQYARNRPKPVKVVFNCLSRNITLKNGILTLPDGTKKIKCNIFNPATGAYLKKDYTDLDNMPSVPY